MKRHAQIVTLLLILFVGVLPRAYSQPGMDSSQDPEASQLYLDLANQTVRENSNLARPILRDQYELAANNDTTNLEANYKAGYYYLITFDRGKAVKYFERVRRIDPDYNFELFFNLGRAHQYAGNFEQAIAYYEQYVDKLVNATVDMSQVKSAGTVEGHIVECRNGLELKSAPIDYTITNLGSTVNSEWPDYAPATDAEETIMVFTSRRNSGNLSPDVYPDDNLYYEDIFVSKRKGESWNYPLNGNEPINTEFHDSNLALSADGKTMFLYSDDNSGDIYYANRINDTLWSDPLPVPGINSSYKENSVSISPDGTLLFFSSDRPGHIGSEPNLDLYVAQRLSNTSWGRPRNLGANINTPNDEEGPFIDYDGTTLYFSSKGWNTMGEHDIFKSTYDSTERDWTTPINMGYPLNSPDDDIYFVSTPDGKRGYYASARADGLGYTDIYEVRIPDIIGLMKEVGPVGSNPTSVATDEGPGDLGNRISGVDTPETSDNTEPEPQPEETETPLASAFVTISVVDQNTKSPVEGQVVLSRVGEDQPLSYTKEGPGIYTWEIPPSDYDGKYYINVNAGEYKPESFRFEIPEFKTTPLTIRREMPLVRPVVGVNYYIKYIFFDFNEATFTADSYSQLEAMKNYMADNPNISIVLKGHTDDIGAKNFNQDLSERRAKAVHDYLVDNGIDPTRLSYLGYGETKPLVSNDDEKEGREINRRVEFQVVGQTASSN